MGWNRNQSMRRLIGLSLLVVLLFSTLPAGAAWDGYEETRRGDVHLVDMDFRTSIAGTGCVANTAIRHGHRYSMYWNHGASSADVYLPTKTTPSDWTQYLSLDMWIYSEKAYNNKFMVIVDCEAAVSGQFAYLAYPIVVDWEGWKQFSVPISAMEANRNPNPANVLDMRLVISGWNMVINPECKLYFGEIKLASADNVSGSAGTLYDPEQRESLTEALGDGYAVYPGGPNAYTAEGTVPIDAQTGAAAISVDGVTFLPSAFFADCLGAAIAQNEDGYTISAGKSSYSGAGHEENGTVYFPAAEAARALGLQAEEADGLVLLGKEGDFSAIVGNALLKEAASYMAAYQAPDAEGLTSEDFKRVKDKWRAQLIGDETLDLSNEAVAARVKAIETAGNTLWQSMNKGKDIEELWGNKITTTWDMTMKYENIRALALAWGTYGSSLYHNTKLRDDILFALQWMNQNRYGEAEMKGTGWRSTSEFNWWDWEIGSPSRLIDTLMIMESELDQKTIAKYLTLVDYKVSKPKWYGSNRLYFSKEIIGSGLLQEDAERVVLGRDGIDAILIYVDDGRNDGMGFYTDGSYVDHMHHPMNGMYGREYLEQISPLINLLEGTEFALCNPQKSNVYNWAIDAFEPLLYRGDTFRFVMGRQPKNGPLMARVTIQSYLALLESAPEPVAEHMKSVIKYMVTEDTTKDYYADLSLDRVVLLSEIMADDSIKPRENYILNKMYYNMDKMVHQHEDYAAGVSMSSSRVYNYECINSENMTGWYLSDGMTYLYTENDPTQYDLPYWSYVDPYRLPGTTVNTGERKAVSIAQGNEYLSSQDFVGGASLGGEYGTAAMYLESYHSNGIGTTVDTGYGGSNPARDCTLEAQKAWFLFDDEVVALGTNIQANDGLPVLTIVENRKSNNTVNLSALAVEPYPVAAVAASAVPEAENTPDNTIDGSLMTRWAADGEATITWDLGEQRELGFAGLAFWQDGARQTIFDLEVSADGVTWEQVFSGRSAGKSEAHSAYTLGGKTARYVRYCGHGNTVSAWNSILEANFYPPNADGSINIPEPNYTGAETVTADGKTLDVGKNAVVLDGASWVQLEGTGGYYFPEAQPVKARKTNSTLSFFELWLDHGTDPQKDTYSYVLLPNKSPEETAAYAQNADIEILVNTPEIQAVREKRLGVTGYVFWKAGTYDGVTVSEPMIVMIKDGGDTVELSACDPTQKLTAGTVTIDRALTVGSADEGVTVTNGKTTAIAIDFTDSHGKSFAAELRSSGGNQSGSGSSSGGSAGSRISGDMPSAGGTPAVEPKSPFDDLGEAAWAAEAITLLYERGVVSPAADGRYRPNDNVTREEFVKLLMEAFGLKAQGQAQPFADESPDAWYAPYLAAARQIGLVTGYDDGRFGVGEQITRQDMAVMAYRAVGLMGKSLPEAVEAAAFRDSSEISGYAAEAVAALQQAGILSGMEDGSFAPAGTASRAQAAKIIAGLMDKMV